MLLLELDSRQQRVVALPLLPPRERYWFQNSFQGRVPEEHTPTSEYHELWVKNENRLVITLIRNSASDIFSLVRFLLREFRLSLGVGITVNAQKRIS